MVILKAVVNGKIIGSVRGYAERDSAYLSRTIVHPYFQGRGIGNRLLDEIEAAFPSVRRFEAKTGHHSKPNIHRLNKKGYEVFKTEPFTDRITWVYLQKQRVKSGTASDNYASRSNSGTN